MPASSIPSPCLSVCYLDREKDHCVGCFRTRAEIGEWSRADDVRRAEIIRDCGLRREDLISRSNAVPARSTP
jgi:predicted Fe-S protein YdhL (DUF1289 family)